MRPPGTAHCRVASDVESRVVRNCDDEFSILFRQLIEELLLQELYVNYGEGGADLLRGKDVAIAHRDRDLHGPQLWLAEQRVPPFGLGESGAKHGVGILRS